MLHPGSNQHWTQCLQADNASGANNRRGMTNGLANSIQSRESNRSQTYQNIQKMMIDLEQYGQSLEQEELDLEQ